MAATRRTVTVDLNEDLVERAVARSGRGAAQEPSEVVEEALAVYLSIKALDLVTADDHDQTREEHSLRSLPVTCGIELNPIGLRRRGHRRD